MRQSIPNTFIYHSHASFRSCTPMPTCCIPLTIYPFINDLLSHWFDPACNPEEKSRHIFSYFEHQQFAAANENLSSVPSETPYDLMSCFFGGDTSGQPFIQF